MTGQLDTGFVNKKFWPKAATAKAEGNPWPETPIAPVPPAQPVAGGWTGGGTPSVALTLSGGPQVGAGTATVTGLIVDGSAITDPAVVPMADGETADQIAANIAAAIDGLQDLATVITLAASSTGATVNVTSSGSSGAGNFDSDPAVAFA